MSTPEKPARPLLERLGGRYLETGKFASLQADDPIHVLNPVERAGLLRVTRGAVLRAALAGAINAAATGFGALFAARVLGHEPAHASWLQQVSYWGLFGVLALIAAVLEIARGHERAREHARPAHVDERDARRCRPCDAREQCVELRPRRRRRRDRRQQRQQQAREQQWFAHAGARSRRS